MGNDLLSDLQNTGVAILNKTADPDQNKTVVVLGVPRSGTTMTSKVLSKLGVYMGVEDDTDTVAEDLEISRLLERNRDENQLRELIAARDAQYKVWGWKRPEAFKYIKRFQDVITNPHFIFMYRDPLAIGLREQISMEADLFESMNRIQQRYNQITRYVQSTKHPCMLVSYEKALLKQGDFVRALARFLDLDSDKALVKQAKQAIVTDDASYLLNTRKKKNRLRGVLDGTSDGTVRGWAYQNENPSPLEVEVHVNGNLVKRLIANHFRKGLEQKGIGNGRHGFQLDVREHLDRPEGKNKIQVLIPEHNFELNKSPLFV